RDRAHDRAPQARRGRGGVAARAHRADPHGGAAGLMRGAGAPVLLLTLGGLAVAADAPVPLGPCGPITRTHDALEVLGAQLHHLGGTPLARLGLLAFRAGRPVPIPFQVDERRGRKLALPGGPEPTADDKPGVLDADDLLVFAACPSPGPNLIDGLRLRAEATLRAALAHWALDEQHGHHELIAWKAGPVRVVRRSRHQVVLGLGIHLTAGLAHTYFYPEHVY